LLYQFHIPAPFCGESLMENQGKLRCRFSVILDINRMDSDWEEDIRENLCDFVRFSLIFTN